MGKSCLKIGNSCSVIPNHIFLKFITGPCLERGLPRQSVPKPEKGKSYLKVGEAVLASLIIFFEIQHRALPGIGAAVAERAQARSKKKLIETK